MSRFACLGRRLALICGLLAAAAAHADTEKTVAPEGSVPPGDMRRAILTKLDYDKAYFERLLALKSQGKSDTKMAKAEFDAECRRAQANVPVLEQFAKERAGYLEGKPLSLPARDEIHRVYTNLFTLLNMLQAAEAGNYKAVADAGGRVVIKDKTSLGLVRSDDSRYYLNLYREFFFLMAVAHYRLGNDHDAVSWLARIEADADLQKLKKQLAQETQKPVDSRVERLNALLTRPVAVVPFGALDKDPQTEWLGAGLAEVLANDLLQHSELLVAERTAVAKVLKEVALSQAGITDDKLAKSVGQLLNAGSLVTGSFKAKGDKTLVTMRIVDAESGRALASADGDVRSADPFPEARQLLLKLLQDAGWVSEQTREEILSARAPKTDTIRDLLAARLALATQGDKAKALYAKAMREDPAYARVFDDLEKQFASISANLAVMPFVNAAGVGDDAWMVQGVQEALTTDLPKMGFNVVERAQLAALLREKQLGEVLDPEQARRMGEQAGADFVVLGSILHQRPELRLDARFVDVRSGLVLNAVTAQGADADLMKVLVTLSVEMAKRFNTRLSDETLAQLSGKKMSREDFEKYARQELAKETLARKVKPVAVKEEPSRAPFWVAAGAAVAGTAVAATGFVLGDKHGDTAAYTEALLQFPASPAETQRLQDDLAREQSSAKTFTLVGYGGIGVAVLSVGYLVYQEVAGGPRTTKTTIEAVPEQPTVSVAPLVGGSAQAAFVGATGTF